MTKVDGKDGSRKVGVGVADGVPDGDGSDVDDEKLFRCHGPCGTSVGTEAGLPSIVDASADKG